MFSLLGEMEGESVFPAVGAAVSHASPAAVVIHSYITARFLIRECAK
jgi:hypothetical protein